MSSQSESLAALTAYLDTRRPDLIAFAHTRLHCPDDAEDIVADVILRAIEAIHRDTTIQYFHAYFMRAIRNALTDNYRRAQSNHATLDLGDSIDAISDYRLPAALITHPNYIEEIVRRDTIQTIWSHLTSSQERAIRLRYADGLSLDEIAVATHTTKNACTQHIHCAINNLRPQLTSHA